MKEIKEQIRKFTEDRDWDQFHNPKDLAIAISIEASELLEHFLWKEADAVSKDMIAHEVADVLIYCIQLCDKMDIDINEAISEKMAENESKYPVDKAKGNATKWNKL